MTVSHNIQYYASELPPFNRCEHRAAAVCAALHLFLLVCHPSDAWNKDLNPGKRAVYLEHRDCCCFPVGVDVVSPEVRTTSVLSAALRACSSHTDTAAITIQLLCALTIILIVALQLAGVPSGNPGDTQLVSQCLLGTDSQGRSLCVYTYVVAALSMIMSAILALLTVSELFYIFVCKNSSLWPSAAFMFHIFPSLNFSLEF